MMLDLLKSRQILNIVIAFSLRSSHYRLRLMCHCILKALDVVGKKLPEHNHQRISYKKRSPFEAGRRALEQEFFIEAECVYKKCMRYAM